MTKTLLVLAAGALLAGSALAQSSLNGAQAQVKPLTSTEAMAIARGEAPQATLCDNFGYVWDLQGAGRTGRVIDVAGTATICGTGNAAGTLTIAQGLPLDVTGQVLPGCFCNEFHQVVVTWNRTTGLFEGTAFAFGGCESQGATQLGRC